MAAAKDCHALITYYVNSYEKKYGSKPNVNRYSARWGFDSILTDISSSKAKSLVDFYFRAESPRRHDLDWFFYNYSKLLDNMADADKDAAERVKLREESRKRAEEWSESGKQGITDA